MQSEELSLKCALAKRGFVVFLPASAFFHDLSEIFPSRSFWQRGGAYDSVVHVASPVWSMRSRVPAAISYFQISPTLPGNPQPVHPCSAYGRKGGDFDRQCGRSSAGKHSRFYRPATLSRRKYLRFSNIEFQFDQKMRLW